MEWYYGLIIGILALIGGVVIGYFAARAMFKREMVKNPPINEKVIKALYMQMGRKPSEAQVKQAMRAIQDAQRR
jgi:uncharacterized protein YneF (UPF0154 family)